MSDDRYKGRYYTVLEIKPERSGSGTDIAAKDVCIPIMTRVGTLNKPDTDLDLDGVVATSPKAKAELDALRAENARLRARISDLQKQISNDQYPPYSAPDPDRFY